MTGGFVKKRHLKKAAVLKLFKQVSSKANESLNEIFAMLANIFQETVVKELRSKNSCTYFLHDPQISDKKMRLAFVRKCQGAIINTIRQYFRTFVPTNSLDKQGY